MDLVSLMKSDFTLTRVRQEDVVSQSYVLNDFVSLIRKREESYPEIMTWLDDRVLSQVGKANRAAFVAHSDGKPVGAAVFKLSKRPKLCHLHVVGESRHQRLGKAFLGLLALRVGRGSGRVHFTIPESIWEEERGFFERFGFRNTGEYSRQYRLFDRELVCVANSGEFVTRALRQLGGLAGELRFGAMKQEPSLLLSIRPRFAHRILEGKKTVEVRKRFSKRWVGHRIAIYSSSPERAVVGEADIEMVEIDSPECIWERYGQQIGCDLGEYLAYCKDKDEVVAIGLGNISRCVTPLEMSLLDTMFENSMRPPQSYFLLADSAPWSKAVSIASASGRASLGSDSKLVES